MTDLISIIGRLMLDGYSDALNLKIGAGYGRMPDYSSAKSFKKRGEWRIIVDKKLVDSNERVISGLLAHELSHIIRMSKLTAYSQKKDMDIYSTKVHREVDERTTDLDVILRGHGSDLLRYKMSLLSSGAFIDGGLSIHEMKKLIYPKKYLKKSTRVLI